LLLPGDSTIVARCSSSSGETCLELELPTDTIPALIAALEQLLELNPDAFPAITATRISTRPVETH
jgi:hypothetical protein